MSSIRLIVAALSLTLVTASVTLAKSPGCGCEAPVTCCCKPVKVKCCPPPTKTVKICVKDPCDCCACPQEVCVKVPCCCADNEVPTLVCCEKGVLGRKVLTYKFASCDTCVEVVIKACGKAKARG